jgi:DNA polymerase-3 subunit chi
VSATVQFYHLLSTSLERAVPKLMEKVLAGGSKALVLVASADQARRVSEALWTQDPASFLPHGGAQEAHAESQPILLSTTEENQNQADILCVLDGRTLGEVSPYRKVLDVFDGADEVAVTAARARWAAYKAKGLALQYVKQQKGGGWKIEAEAA